MKNLLLISLGCVKNAVDSETVLSFFNRNDFKIVLDPEKADVIVIGCLVERYYEDLKKEIPEVDLFIRIKDYKNMSNLVKGLFNDEIKEEYNPYYRVLSTPKYSAYLKISDGCSNHCAYCAIPLIRGEFHSIEKEILLKEAKRLGESGVKELIIISQDTTKYGSDIYKDYDIASLLDDILKLKLFKFIRLLYLYSYEVSDRLITLIKKNSEVLLPYFDIPIQHSTNKMLKLMNRKDKQKDIINLVKKVRNNFKNAILRTTIITGFPGENKRDFISLKKFLLKYKFDHLGVFSYSREEDTPSFNMPHQVREKTKELRKSEIMKQQSLISYDLNKKHVGEVMNGIITYKLKENEYTVRTYFNAPDDIDGNIYIRSNTPLKEGDIVKIKINSSSFYDLSGELLEIIEN